MNRTHATQAPFVYGHEWQIGDVVMWDNGFLMHRRDEFDPEALRWLKRTTLYLPPDRHIVPTWCPPRRVARDTSAVRGGLRLRGADAAHHVPR